VSTHGTLRSAPIIGNGTHGVCIYVLKAHVYRLAIETGRWHKPIAVPVDENKCRTCIIWTSEKMN